MTETVGDFCYSKKDLVGHGAFAVVFKGQHKRKEDFVVAIKVISKKNLSKTQSLLAKEIKILKELHHENVVALYDCQEHPSSVYLVMEYCNGGDLADYLQVKGTLSEDTIRFFLKQIASAMYVLQSKGIVHRDLKPQNILLNHSGSPNPSPSEIKVKIADFGFARFLPGEMMAATLCGSPMYMAPEVIMSKAYDAKADLWSLGTIVYQCLTGKAPFQANSPQALKKFYEKNKGVCPNIPAGTSNHIRDLLTGLLKRNPKDRMDFSEFFTHPFLTGRIVQRSSTPVAVPSRTRNYSGSSQGTQSPSSSPSYGAEALGNIRVDLLHRITPPYDMAGSPPQGISPVNPGSIEQSPRDVYCNIHQAKRRSGGFMATSPCPDDEPEDFVMVPNAVDANDGFNKGRAGWDAYFPYDCQSPPRTSPNSNSPRTPPRRATFVVGSPSSSHSPPITMTTPRSRSSANEPTDIERLYGQSAPTGVPVPRRVRTYSSPGPAPNISPGSLPSAPIPVPRKNSKTGSFSSPMRESANTTGTLTSRVSRPQTTHDDTIAAKPRGKMSPSQSSPLITAVAKTLTDNSKAGFYNLTDLNTAPLACGADNNLLGRPAPGMIRRALSNIEPMQSSSPLLSALARQTSPGLMPLEPLTENTEGRPILKVHSSPAILATAMALPRNKAVGFVNAGQLRLALGPTQRIRRHSSGPTSTTDLEDTTPLATTPPSLPPIPGSPTKSFGVIQGDHEGELKPLKGLFTGGSTPPSPAMTSGDIIPFKSLPKYSGQDTSTHGALTGSPSLVKPGKGTKVTRGFSEIRTGTINHVVGPLSPDMEGPIALIAPELPEDTLMETEHTDGVRKLNFALSLVDAILEIIRARRAPLTTIADSMALRMNESLLTDQIGNINEECRSTEQLVLYMKTLRILSLALRFAKDELKEHRLKPSNAVKNVVNDLNVRYHQCLERSSQIKNSLQGRLTPGKVISANADKLIYMYAMAMCQNAALDELFGNPQQCREKYETAQLLLQGLEGEVKKDSDLALLQRYKMSVDQRLAHLNRRKASASAR